MSTLYVASLPEVTHTPFGPVSTPILILVAAVVLGVLFTTAWIRGRMLAGNQAADKEYDREQHAREVSSRWLRLKDAAHLVLPDPDPDVPVALRRIPFGYLGGKRLAWRICEPVLVYAPTGAGKTSRLVVPAALDWNGSMVMTVVKPDALMLTLEARRSRGPVAIFDPTNSTGMGTCKWTPLLTATTFAGALKAAEWLVDSSKVSKLTSEQQNFWDTLGKDLLAPLLFAAARTGRDMVAVARWVLLRQYDEVTKVLEELGDFDAHARWAASLATAPQTMQSVFATAQRILAAFTHPEVVDALSPDPSGEDTFDPEEFLSQGGTLYCVGSPSDQEDYTPIFETLINCIVKAAQRRHMETKKPLSPRLLLCFEETANCAPLRKLPGLCRVARGQGIQILTVWQDEASIDRIYGREDGASLRANHTLKMILPGVSDDETLERFSKLLGPMKMRREQLSTDATYLMHSRDPRRQVSASFVDVPLAPVDWLRTLATNRAVCIAGREQPIKVTTRAWWEDPRLNALVPPEVAEDMRRAALDEEEEQEGLVGHG